MHPLYKTHGSKGIPIVSDKRSEYGGYILYTLFDLRNIIRLDCLLMGAMFVVISRGVKMMMTPSAFGGRTTKKVPF